MSASPTEYLVLSRGKWDPDLSPERIQKAIDDFYAWHDRLVGEGKMIAGRRLAHTGATVSKRGLSTDGPYGESKEVVGGYWFVVASSLEDAAKIMSENPCIQCGLEFEIRPFELERASAYRQANETPANT
jgi:hypothetical protein